MKNKKLLNKILSAFTISAFCIGMISPCYKSANASSGTYSALASALLQSNGLSGFDTSMIPIKISKYVSYSYVSPEDAKVKIECIALNKESTYPTANGEGSYTCTAIPMSSNIFIPTSQVTRNVTFKEEGKTQIVSISFPYQTYSINKDTGQVELKASNEEGAIVQPIEVNLKIKVPRSAKTTIDEGVDAEDSTVVVSTNQNSLTTDANNGSSTTYNPDGTVTISTCSDGTLFCPQEQTTNTTTNNGTNDNSGLKTDLDNQQPTLNNNPFDNDNNDNYKNLLDDLLDYSNKNTDPYNSSDTDWINSNGGNSGDGNLDDWFSGVPENEEVPTDMTTDDTGVDDILTNNAGSYQGDVYETNPDYQDVVLDYNGGDNDGMSSSVLPMDNLDQAFQDGLNALSGNDYELNGDNSNLLGSMDASSKDGSLGDKLKMLLGDTNGNTKRGTASDQELYDIEKKWLLANGFTMADIRSGKNYDANSAYTEPTVAWDMNRITTLLKGRKISLTSPTELKKDTSSKSTLSKSVNDNKKK